MSILIKGMEVPESGTYEVSIDSANGKDKTVMSLFVRGEGGLIYCGVYELIPVPRHGRLVDADAFLALINDSTILSDFLKCIINPLIRGEPTVIEAEEGET